MLSLERDMLISTEKQLKLKLRQLQIKQQIFGQGVGQSSRVSDNNNDAFLVGSAFYYLVTKKASALRLENFYFPSIEFLYGT